MDGGSGVSEKKNLLLSTIASQWLLATIITTMKLDKLSTFEEEDKVSGGVDRDNE